MRLNVLHIFHDFGAFHLNLMEAQRALGINASGFYYSTRHMSMQKADMPYVHTHNSSVRIRRSLLFFYSRIKKAGKVAIYSYAKQTPDILHAHMLFSDGSLAFDIHTHFGTPYFVAVRNADLNTEAFWRFPRIRKRGMQVLEHASAVVFLTPAYRDRLLARLPQDLRDNVARKAIVSMNGIDRFWHENTYTDKLRVQSKPLQVITVGDICANKNQTTVAEALQMLRDQGEDITYRVVGRLSDSKITRKLNSYDFVTLEPHCNREKLLELYRSSDIFVLPSIHETFGLVYAEAMTQGIPLVYTQGEGFDGQFQENEVGFAVDPYSASSIAIAIQSIEKDYARLSESCIKNAARFDWATIAQSYIEQYRIAVDSERNGNF